MALPWLTNALDTMLDRGTTSRHSRLGSIAPGHWWPDDADGGSLTGRRVVVTGATAGVGRATAFGVARLGATVHLVGRSAERLEETAAAIRREVDAPTVFVEPCDISDLDAVRAYAEEVSWHASSLHAVVHNAGVIPSRRTESAQGHELALATHVLGPFLLTELLRRNLAGDPDGRVVWISSGGLYTQPFTHDVATDLEYRASDYTGPVAYARTKRMQAVVAALQAARLDADGIAVHSMHPAIANADVAPGRASSSAIPDLLAPRTYEDLDTTVWAGTAPAVVAAEVEDDADHQALWDFCLRATGVTG